MDNEGTSKQEVITIGNSENTLDNATKEYVDHVDDILEDIHLNNPSVSFAERLQLQKSALDTLISEWDVMAKAAPQEDSIHVALLYAKERLAAMNVLEERVEA